ncbi:DUF4142 domain-containing protein [Actinoplanes sp. N902-109]|uniref:DUF4142 domain-containing protein n=1 Tax=Actinoplanes sp. (strain N902-109) TaxID=649831 RepID=UPI00032954AD|nr:DUF4142 domain-containing protein [Actinoplanes sp. N902-109]AGL20726.1 hypothetical protein L083_7216 [Actinoplanes sp. N902-109]
MSMRRLAVLAAVSGLLLAPGTAAFAAPSDQDAAYLKAAHQSNLAEIAGGKLAQSKGADQQVKDLGERFVSDHTKLDSALQQTASSLGVDLPDAPNAEQQALAKRYQAASGDTFDTLFVSTQMDAHMKAMNLGRTELSQGSDAQAKKAAQDAAPVIESHHSALDSAARDLGVPSSVNTGTGGQADRGGISTTAVGLMALGFLLVAAAAVLFRRRTARA